MPLIQSKKMKTKGILSIAGISLLPALGIACFRLSAWTLYTSDIGANEPNMFVVSRVLQLCAIVLILILDRQVSYGERTVLRVTEVAVLGMMVGAMIFLLAPNDTYIYVGVGINGTSSAALMLAWGFYLCSVEPRISAFSLTLAFALHGVMTWVLPLVPSQLITIMMVSFPLLSYLCFRTSISSGSIDLTPDAPLKRQSLSAVPWGIFTLMFICTISSILAKLFAPLSPVLLASPYYQFWPAIMVAIFLLYFVWILVLKRDDQERLWPVFVLVLFSGLLCYSSFATTQPDFAAGFFRATSECLMLFCWLIAASVVFRGKLPRVFCFGLTVVLFTVPPTIVSSLLSMLFPAAGAEGDELQAVIITAIIAFIMVLATILSLGGIALSQAKAKKLSGDAPPPPPPSLATVVDELGSIYGFTKREGEVAQCLVKGYTFSQTAETLFISLDTVRTHAKSLYRKMDINKKQQFIALAEERLSESEKTR